MLSTTNTSLLAGLRDRSNDACWSEFFGRYQPLLVGFGHKLGLSETDAQDAAQETLMAFVSTYREGGYDRQKGRLRTWLMLNHWTPPFACQGLGKRHGPSVASRRVLGRTGSLPRASRRTCGGTSGRPCRTCRL